MLRQRYKINSRNSDAILSESIAEHSTTNKQLTMTTMPPPRLFTSMSGREGDAENSFENAAVRYKKEDSVVSAAVSARAEYAVMITCSAIE